MVCLLYCAWWCSHGGHRPPANAPSPRRVSAFAKKIFRTKDNARRLTKQQNTRRHLQERGTKLFLRPGTRVAPLNFMPGDDDEFKFNTNPPTPWHRQAPAKTKTRGAFMPGVRNGSSISVFVVVVYWKRKSNSSFPRVVPRFREAATAKTSQVRRLSEHQKSPHQSTAQMTPETREVRSEVTRRRGRSKA